MPKQTYRVRNWKEYNKSVVKRGSVTLWFEEKALANWYELAKPGGRRLLSAESHNPSNKNASKYDNLIDERESAGQPPH